MKILRCAVFASEDCLNCTMCAVQARRYAFKCHRKSDTGRDTVYPVNAIAFHPIHGTFASGGTPVTLDAEVMRLPVSTNQHCSRASISAKLCVSESVQDDEE